jgi:hypothetical protein
MDRSLDEIIGERPVRTGLNAVQYPGSGQLTRFGHSKSRASLVEDVVIGTMAMLLATA